VGGTSGSGFCGCRLEKEMAAELKVALREGTIQWLRTQFEVGCLSFVAAAAGAVGGVVVMLRVGC
jgi:hypothetical protein